MKHVIFSARFFYILLFNKLLLLTGVVNAQSLDVDSNHPIKQLDTISNLYKNPYNDVSLLSIELIEHYNLGTKLKFKNKLKTFTSRIDFYSGSKFLTTYKYYPNGYLSESIGIEFRDGIEQFTRREENIKFSTIKSKSGILYILPEYFLFPSLLKDYKDKFEDFNKNNDDIEDFLLIYKKIKELTQFLLKFDQNENLIYYRNFIVENDSLKKTITLKSEKKGILETSKVFDYNLRLLKDYTNPYLNDIYSYNENGDIIKISVVLRDGNISREEFYLHEYNLDGKLIKTIVTSNKTGYKKHINYYYDDSNRIIRIIRSNEDFKDILDFEYY